MQKLKFIYFDVGGVTLFDFSGTNKWEEMLEAIGVNGSNRGKFDEIWKKYKKRRCIDFDIDLMAVELREYVGLEIDEGFSFLDEFVQRFEPNISIWPVIKYARKNFKIGLLTDQYPRMLDEIYKRRDLMPEIDWDVVVDSSIVKHQKKGPEIFKIAQKLAKVENPQDILFIDNTEEKLTHAQALGWQTFLYDPTRAAESSSDLFQMIKKKM